MQQVKVLIEEAVRNLDLKMKGKLYLITMEQIAFCKDVMITTHGFGNRLIILENKMN